MRVPLQEFKILLAKVVVTPEKVSDPFLSICYLLMPGSLLAPSPLSPLTRGVRQEAQPGCKSWNVRLKTWKHRSIFAQLAEVHNARQFESAEQQEFMEKLNTIIEIMEKVANPPPRHPNGHWYLRAYVFMMDNEMVRCVVTTELVKAIWRVASTVVALNIAK
jgi:membrane-bound lytic murein transglycosylase B